MKNKIFFTKSSISMFGNFLNTSLSYKEKQLFRILEKLAQKHSY